MAGHRVRRVMTRSRTRIRREIESRFFTRRVGRTHDLLIQFRLFVTLLHSGRELKLDDIEDGKLVGGGPA